MRFLPFVIPVVLAIYCWIELAQSDPRDVRQLPRGLWALIIAIPLVGPIGWLVYGRPNGDDPTPVAPRQRSHQVAPDDDPDFLRNLKIDPPDS
jgi:Phospholipase_D-nuclease N-terminal